MKLTYLRLFPVEWDGNKKKAICESEKNKKIVSSDLA